MPQTKPGNNWDVDLDFGLAWEKRVCSMFEGDGSLEIKADRKWHETGNLVFERRYRGQPSGLSTSEAKWWVIILTSPDDPHKSECNMIWDTKKLKSRLNALTRNGKASKLLGGYEKQSELVVVPIKDLAP